MQIYVTIASGFFEGAGVEFPTFPLTCVVVLKTLWYYRDSDCYEHFVNSTGSVTEEVHEV